MVEKLRTKYGIINADYSYVVIAKKRMLYEAMRNATEDLSNAYYKMDHAIVEYSIAVQKCASSLSAWLSESEQGAKISTVTGAAYVLGWAATNEASLSACKNRTSRVVDMMMGREVGPESMIRMSATSPMPMVVNWHASYFMLHAVFDTAVMHLDAEVSEIEVCRVEGGMYQAAAGVSICPTRFISEPSNTKNAAKAKLMFKVVKYMEEIVQCRIMDLNHVLKEYMEDHIDHFEQRIELVWQCGNWLIVLANTLSAEFGRKTLELKKNISADEKAAAVVNIVDICAEDLERAASNLGNCMNDFVKVKSQATRESIEASVSGGGLM